MTANSDNHQVDYSNTTCIYNEVDGKIPTNTLTTDYLTKWNGSSFENSNIINKINSNNSNFQYVGIAINDPKANLQIGSILPVDNLLHLSVDATLLDGISFSHEMVLHKLAAYIKAEQYEVNDNRTNLVFGTRSTNSSSATADDKVIIRYDGNVGIGVPNLQIRCWYRGE